MTNTEEYRKQYKNKISCIHKDIAAYSYTSFLEQAVSYLSQDLGPEKNLMKMPWIVVLAIKWSALHGEKGTKPVSKDIFIRFVNRIYKLQHLASELGKESVNWKLSIRRFFLNQRWYQTNDKDGLIFLTRCHYIMCSKPFDQNYYEKSFYKANGFTLNSFIQMSLYMAKSLFLIPQTGLVKIDIGELLTKFTPHFTEQELASFISFISVRSDQLPDFFREFEYHSSPAIEYFEVTPLKHKPFIFSNNKLIAVNSKIAINGITELLTNFFIKNDAVKFTKCFGRDFESYIANQIGQSKLVVITEKEIEELYVNNGLRGEVVDFVTQSKSPVFIEAKGIQPNKENILTSDDRLLLKDRLSKSFMKGFGQAQECRFFFDKMKIQVSEASFALVVTHKDFFVLDAKDYAEQIDPELKDKVTSEYGYLPLPLEHCFFVTIHDLEVLLLLVNESSYTLEKILKIIVEREKNNDTSRMSFTDHIRDIDPNRKYASTTLTKHFDLLAEESAKWELLAKKFWSGKIPFFYQSIKSLNIAIEELNS